MHNFHFNAPRFLFDFAHDTAVAWVKSCSIQRVPQKLQLSRTAGATKNCNFLENLAQERPHSRGETLGNKSPIMLFYFSVAAGGQN